MAKLHELKPAGGARKTSRRVGRGPGSGSGKTAGRGHKGQKARAGASIRPGFEGGQMPLQRRVPKRGFHNQFRREYTEVNVSTLNRFAQDTVVTPELLREAGVVKQVHDGIKVLGRGELSVALTVRAHRFTEGARQKIQEAGGKVEVI